MQEKDFCHHKAFVLFPLCFTIWGKFPFQLCLVFVSFSLFFFPSLLLCGCNVVLQKFIGFLLTRISIQYTLWFDHIWSRLHGFIGTTLNSNNSPLTKLVDGSGYICRLIDSSECAQSIREFWFVRLSISIWSENLNSCISY